MSRVMHLALLDPRDGERKNGGEVRVLCPLEVADSYESRLKGVIGRDELEGAILLQPAYLGIHTFGVRFPLDVAFLDGDLKVLKVSQLEPRRLEFCLRSRAVLEAPAGSFESWGVVVGTQLGVINAAQTTSKSQNKSKIEFK